jgi:hypothetical protein
MCYIGQPQEIVIVDPLVLPAPLPRHEPEPDQPVIVPVPVTEPTFATKA